jgi:hypothetical protein
MGDSGMFLKKCHEHNQPGPACIMRVGTRISRTRQGMKALKIVTSHSLWRIRCFLCRDRHVLHLSVFNKPYSGRFASETRFASAEIKCRMRYEMRESVQTIAWSYRFWFFPTILR